VRVPKDVKIVDIGGDHRYVEGWAYGLADVWPAQIEGQVRVANPGCYPAATLNALAPLLVNKLIEPGNIVVDVKTGISGAGRGGADSKFGYAESNENLLPYSLLKHVHMPEIAKTIERLSSGSAAGLVFTPHLVPMTRGVLATIYCRGRATTSQCLDAARRFYAGRAFVRVTDKPPQTKWATGSNLAFVSYAADPERNLVIAARERPVKRCRMRT
jgi:N-acetyl-gamma-glutamyl-phosphate reductase